MNGHTTRNAQRTKPLICTSGFWVISRERQRERESTACSIASNDWSLRRLCSILLTGVQVEPWTINTDRLGHHKKCPYLRGVHINLSGPCYVNYVNLKINHLLKQNTGGIRGWTRESCENRVMKHDISIIKLNISGLPYVLLCSWKHALISLKVNAQPRPQGFSLKSPGDEVESMHSFRAKSLICTLKTECTAWQK